MCDFSSVVLDNAGRADVIDTDVLAQCGARVLGGVSVLEGVGVGGGSAVKVASDDMWEWKTEDARYQHFDDA
jgi:hypothetical protein